jgi:hypothetical protein
MGDQYLLSSDEYSYLSNLLNISSLPTYVLVDKRGYVNNRNAPRPSDGPITINAINSLLR